MQDAIESSAPSQVVNDAPVQTGLPNGKPFVLGTLDAEELQEYVTDWIEGALSYGADSADALKHHVEMVAHAGPTGWHGEAQITSVQLCMMDTTLSCDSTDKLFGAFAGEYIFPNVDWQRACKDAMQRIIDGRANYRADQETRDQARDDQIRDEAESEAAVEVEAQAAEESTEPAVSQTPPNGGDGALYALRFPSGEWVGCDVHEDPKLYEVSTFRTSDEAAAERHALELSDAEIVPMLPADAKVVHMVEENRRLKQDNAALQKENDEFAHELGNRNAAIA